MFQIIILLTIFLLSNLVNGFLNLPCDPSGTLICNTPNSVATITNANTTVQNCVFINCGSVIISGGSVNLYRVTIRQCGTSTCAPVRLTNGANANLKSVSFLDNRAGADSGAIMVPTNSRNNASTIILTDAIFRNCSAPSAAGIRLDHGHILNCTNCIFDGMVTAGSGTAIQTGDQCNLYFQGGACQNTIGGGAGCVYMSGSGNLGTFDQFNFYNNSASGLSAGVWIFGGTVLVKNSIFSAISTFGGDGAVLHCQGSSSLLLNNCSISDVYCATSGGVASVKHALLDIRNTVIRRVDSNGAGLGYAFNGNFYFVNCTFDNAGMRQQKESFWTLGSGTTLTAINTRFLNANTPAGGNILAIQSPVSINLDGCTFSNNKVASTGGAIYLFAAVTLQIRNCVFSNNMAGTHGGAIYSSSGAIVTLLEGNVFTGNQANGNGGALLVTSSSVVNFLQPQSSSGNIALGLGSFLYSDVTDLGNIKVSSLSPNVLGSLFISDNNNALSIRSALIFGFPNASLQGYPAQLLLYYIDVDGLERQLQSGSKSTPDFNILIQETLPDLKIRSADVYGNIVDAKLINPIIPHIMPLDIFGQSSVSLRGQTIGAIVDSKSKSATLRKVSVTNAQPNVMYALTLEDLSFTVSPVTPEVFNSSDLRSFVSFPNFTVSYSSCKDGSEIFLLDSCYPLLNVSSSLKIAFAILAVIGIVIASLFGIGLLRSKDSFLVTINGFSFHAFLVFGSILSFLNILVLTVAPVTSSSCLASAWLENLGFFTVILSLLIMSYRSGLVFSNINTIEGFEIISKGMSSGANVSGRDRSLLSYLTFGIVALAGFLLSWSVIDPPAPSVHLLSNNQVTNSWCFESNSSFFSVIKGARICLLIFTGIVAYNHRTFIAPFGDNGTTRNGILDSSIKTGTHDSEDIKLPPSFIKGPTTNLAVRTSAKSATPEDKQISKLITEVAQVFTDSNKYLAFSVFNWIIVGGFLNLFGSFVVVQGSDLAYTLLLGSDLFSQLVNLFLLIGVKLYILRLDSDLKK